MLRNLFVSEASVTGTWIENLSLSEYKIWKQRDTIYGKFSILTCARSIYKLVKNDRAIRIISFGGIETVSLKFTSYLLIVDLNSPLGCFLVSL